MSSLSRRLRRRPQPGSVAPAPVAGKVLFDGGYQTGDFSQWSGIQAPSNRQPTIVADPDDLNNKVGRFELLANDDAGGSAPGHRSEVFKSGTGHKFVEGDVRWFEFRLRLAASFAVLGQPGNGNQHLLQWKNDGSGSSPFDMRILEESRGGTISLVDRRTFSSPRVYWKLPQALSVSGTDVWHNFLLGVKFSSDATIGSLELWHAVGPVGTPLVQQQMLVPTGATADGKRVRTDTLRPPGDGRDVSYWKQGYYSGGDMAFEGVVLHDRARVATTREALEAPQTSQTGWYSYGSKPALTVSELRTLARAQYDYFLAYTLATDGMPAGMPAGAKRIKVPDQVIGPATQAGGTVSEGMGYGMLLSAWFGDPALPPGIYDANAQANFDALYTYVKFYRNSRGLMNWNIRHDGTVADTGGATDGDEDIALALVVAHRNWGSGGTINYGAEATSWINAIRDHEFTPANYTGVGGPNVMMNGDQWGVDKDNYMPDYFSPGWFREFGKHTGDTARWDSIIAKNYQLAPGYFFNNFTGGVVPDRCKRNGTIADPNNTYHYKATYNSVRMGFRLVADFLWNGPNADALSSAMTKRAATKAKGLWATGGAVKAPPYDLDLTAGEPYGNNSGRGLFGPCGLVDSAHATWAAEIAQAIRADTEASYFNQGVGTMALAFMAGIAVPGGSAPSAAPRPTTGLASLLDRYTGSPDANMYQTMQGSVVSDKLRLDATERFDCKARVPTNFVSAYLKWDAVAASSFRVHLRGFKGFVDFVFRPGSPSDGSGGYVEMHERDGGVLVGTRTQLTWATFPGREGYFKIENTGTEWVWSANAGPTPPAVGEFIERKRQAHQVAPGSNEDAVLRVNAESNTLLVVDDLGVYY